MASICPTVLASDPHTYREQMTRVATLAGRVQIDLMDGEFAPAKSVGVIQVWWPEGVVADLHLMFQRPIEQIETLVSLSPSMVIVHAEADGDLAGCIRHLQKFGIRVGVALLAETKPEGARNLIEIADHALIFSGDLGHYGGHARLESLRKVTEIKSINPGIEIGWDGGADESNVLDLARGGVDVINVGGAIQRASNPQKAYDTLVAKISAA